MSEVMRRAQFYRDFGYGWGFKERHPIQQWFRAGRYPSARLDAEGRWSERSVIKRRCFEVPPSHMQPVLPRWSNR